MSMAKTFRRAFALALLVALLASFAVVAQATTNYYCTANRVNLREGPSSSYGSKAKLMKGDVVTYMSKKNGWYYVKYYKKSTNTVVEGYVYRKYLSSVAPSKNSKSVSISNTYKTTVNLRVRSEPSIEVGYVKKKLKAGTKVTVIKQKRSWVYVTYKGGSGWVSAKYLKKVSK